MPTSDCASVIRISSRCCASNSMADGSPRDIEYTIGSIAARSVHWLMLLDTMFIRAIDARSIVRAQ